VATCNVSTLVSQACSNDFLAAAQDEKLFRAIKLQLLCNLSVNGGGGGSSFTVESEATPALPYSFTATLRTHVEINVDLNSAGTAAQLTVAKTGVPNQIVRLIGAAVQHTQICSIILGPGDTLTLTDTSTAPALMQVLSVIKYIG
jgi:hypothetical protein